MLSPCADYVKGCADTVIKIHQREAQGDILVFLTGRITRMLNVELKENKVKIYF